MTEPNLHLVIKKAGSCLSIFDIQRWNLPAFIKESNSVLTFGCLQCVTVLIALIWALQLTRTQHVCIFCDYLLVHYLLSFSPCFTETTPIKISAKFFSSAVCHFCRDMTYCSLRACHCVCIPPPPFLFCCILYFMYPACSKIGHNTLKSCSPLWRAFF